MELELSLRRSHNFSPFFPLFSFFLSFSSGAPRKSKENSSHHGQVSDERPDLFRGAREGERARRVFERPRKREQKELFLSINRRPISHLPSFPPLSFLFDPLQPPPDSHRRFTIDQIRALMDKQENIRVRLEEFDALVFCFCSQGTNADDARRRRRLVFAAARPAFSPSSSTVFASFLASVLLATERRDETSTSRVQWGGRDTRLCEEGCRLRVTLF